MRDITDIIEDVVNQMDNTLKITKVGGNNVYFCDLKWFRLGKAITGEDSQPYLVDDVNYTAKKLTLSLPFTSPETTVTFDRPYYFHGTPMTTNNEWQAFTNNEEAKCPFIWLIEPVSEVFNGYESVIERESEVRLLFIDNRDSVNWINDDIHENRSTALYGMVDEFIATLERLPNFKRNLQYSVRNLTKLGTENSNGFERNIISADLTALDVRITLPIYKESLCNC